MPNTECNSSVMNSLAFANSSIRGGSEARNISVMRRHPILNECENSTPSWAEPKITSVEPPPTSTTTNRSPGNSAEAPRKERSASTSPAMTSKSTPSSCRRETSSPALRASREALVATVPIGIEGTSSFCAIARTSSRYSFTQETTRSIASS